MEKDGYALMRDGKFLLTATFYGIDAKSIMIYDTKEKAQRELDSFIYTGKMTIKKIKCSAVFG